ncbi:MAG: Ig-like domain-containing protein, partial [bacterium]
MINKIKQIFQGKSESIDPAALEDFKGVDQALKGLAKAKAPTLSEAKKDAMLAKIFQGGGKPQSLFSKTTESLGNVLNGIFSVKFALKLAPVLAVIVLVAAVGWFAAPAPEAYGSLKGHTVEIYRNASFKIIFTEQMNQKSVEQALRVTPQVAGSFSWDKNSLTYTPSAPLVKGGQYEVFIDTSATNIFYKKLKEPYRQTFTVLDFPEVAVVAPTENAEIRKNQRITVVFDHPIRTLTESLAVPDFLRIEPAVKGKYEWLGTSGFEFIPAGGWPDAEDFTVTLPSGTKMADGGSTLSDYVWRFHTQSLMVFGNTYGTLRDLAAPASITFNYFVPADAVKGALVIKANGNKLSNDDFTFTRDPKIKDLTKSLTVLIKPKAKFELGKTYTLELPEGFTGGVGTRGLPEPLSMNFNTGEKGFAFVRSCPADGMSKQINESAILIFNNPVDEKTYKAGIKVTPALEEMEMSESTYSMNKECSGPGLLGINGKWQPSTTYTISFDSDLKDVYGQALQGGKSITFETKAYPPSATLSSYSQFGFLASHLPRLYQVKALNISMINVRLCRLDFEPYLTENYSYQTDKDWKLGCPDEVRKEIQVNGTLNNYKIVDLDLDEIAGRKLAQGYYLLQVKMPELDEWRSNQSRVFEISDTALTVKTDNGGKMLVWATGLETGEARPNMNVEVFQVSYSDKARKTVVTKVTEGQTNQDGLVELAPGLGTSSYSSLFVRATEGEHLGVVSTGWNDGIDPWNYSLTPSYGSTANRYLGYIYSDRMIYRPDQMVYFKGVFRRDNDAKVELPTIKNITVTVNDASGKEIYKKEVPVSAYGTFNSSFELEPEMPLGYYRINASAYVNGYGDQVISGSFQVAEYRRPDFKVTLAPPTSPVYSGEPLNVEVTGSYYYGAALAGATVNWTVDRRAYHFDPFLYEWYSFTNSDAYECYWYCRSEGDFQTVASGTGTLDAEGKLKIAVPANLTDYKSSANYVVNVNVMDVSNRLVSAQAEVPVHKADLYVGIRSNYEKGWSSPEMDFDLVSVNTDKTTRAYAPLTVKLYKRVWTSTKKDNADGSYFWDYQKTDTLVASQSVTTDNEGKALATFRAPESGDYVAVAEGRDSRGRVTSASVSRYVYGGSYASLKITDDHQMKIIQNKADYKPGDVASLIVQTPYENTKALVTVERETIRSYQVIDLGAGNQKIEIPITEAEVPNVYVSVLAVKGNALGVPEFRLGYANLQVNTSSKVLEIGLAPDKKIYKPGEEVTIQIKTQNLNGAAKQAELSLAVVDERIVALMGTIDKNILGKFWFQRSIGVRTSQSLTMLVKKVFFSTEGGAGGKGDENASSPLRGNFLDTAFWKADVVTNSAGLATVKFKLPDNLTTWQILAIGATKDTVVGSAETSIMTQKDLMIEPVLPRFVRYNDTLTLGATVYNATSNTENVEVKIQAVGLTLKSPASKWVTLPPNSRDVVKWQVKVPYGGTEAKITISGKAGSYEDGFEVTLPIHDFSVAEIVGTAGVLYANATETLELPEDILKDRGELKLSVSPGLGDNLGTGLKYLMGFEYECAEQTTSKLLGNIMFAELAKQKITAPPEADVKIAEGEIRSAVFKLIASQRMDGGWDYWSDGNKSSSKPYLSSHVLYGLLEAKRAGYDVGEAVIQKASNYL